MKNKRQSSRYAKGPAGKAGFSTRNTDTRADNQTAFRNSDKRGQDKRQQEKPGQDKRGKERRGRSTRGKAKPDRVYLYGMHTVRAALENQAREKYRLHATENALGRLNIDPALIDALEIVPAETGGLGRLVGGEAVHQGVVLEAAPLPAINIENMEQKPLVLVLDQITDPHNVGAILRTAVAMDAGAVISTARNSALESGVLAKSASGAVDMIDHIQIGNLARAIERLSDQGYFCIGLDSEGPAPLEETFAQAPNDGRFIALVLGAEGQGLRKKTRETCNALARLDMPGVIKSLNVSNAAAISLYAARKYLDK